MNALILERFNLIHEYQYIVIDRRSFRKYQIVTHDSYPIGSRVTLNIDTLKSIKLLSDIGAYHPHS